MANKHITNTSNSGITVTTVDASSMTPSTNSSLQVGSSNGNFKISCPNILHSTFPKNDAGVTNNETSSTTNTKRFRVGNGTCGQKIPPTKGVDEEDNISPGNSLSSK